MNDVHIATVEDLDQTVCVLVGLDYVALEIDYWNQDAETCSQPDAVVLLESFGALRLAYALGMAFLKAWEASASIAGATTGES